MAASDKEMAAQASDQLEYDYALERYHIEMAANLRDRLARMDEAIELIQTIRKETSELFTELFPEAA